jgi:putative transcriptional regulator
MNQTVQNTVYDYRQRKGMTQEELAERVNVSRQTIISIEKGNYVPSVLLALRFSKVFHCSVNDLFSITHEK